MDTLSYAVGWIAVHTALLMSFGAVIVAVVEIEFSAAKRRRAARAATQQQQPRLEVEQRRAA